MLTLPRLVADPPLAGSRILGLTIAPDARWLMFLRGSEADSEMLDLWGMPLTAAGAEPRLLVRARDIVGQKDEALSEEERMARERQRMRRRGLVSYSYCGEDGHDLLLTLHGDLYHVVPKSPAPEITRLTADGGPKLDVRCSPRGTMASYVKDNEVYAALVKTSKTRKLTQGATDTLHHGVAEFVAQEEMGRFDGHWWSKDERYLAYTEVDVSPVGIKRRPRMHADRADIGRVPAHCG
jgi:dipeptidyl-peptidase 4